MAGSAAKLEHPAFPGQRVPAGCGGVDARLKVVKAAPVGLPPPPPPPPPPLAPSAGPVAPATRSAAVRTASRTGGVPTGWREVVSTGMASVRWSANNGFAGSCVDRFVEVFLRPRSSRPQAQGGRADIRRLSIADRPSMDG